MSADKKARCPMKRNAVEQDLDYVKRVLAEDPYLLDQLVLLRHNHTRTYGGETEEF